jgi:hypothetical protein
MGSLPSTHLDLSGASKIPDVLGVAVLVKVLQIHMADVTCSEHTLKAQHQQPRVHRIPMIQELPGQLQRLARLHPAS